MTTQTRTEFDFAITSGGADGNGNMADIDGWDLSRFEKNPVIFFNHQWNNPPVGRALRLTRVDDTIIARIAMAPSAMGTELANLIDTGFLNGASTGWRPTEWELRRDDKSRILGIHSHKQELLEVSIVGLPARPDTLRQAQLQDSLQADYQSTLTPAALLADLSEVNVLLSTSMTSENRRALNIDMSQIHIVVDPELSAELAQDPAGRLLQEFNANLRG